MMKAKIVETLPVIVLLALLTGCGNYYDYSDYYDIYGNAGKAYSVTVWSSSDSNIDIFVDGNRVGTVTQKYLTAPDCGAAGCVMYSTFDGGKKITLRGESADGKVKWSEKSFRLNRDCRKVQLVTNSDGVQEVLVN
jgi:hypothetical protein